jgi:CRISPR-associated protein Csx14
MSDDRTLVVTMGGQAQVVTFALDWLLAQGESIREVVVVHLSPGDARTSRALSQVAAEFSGDRYRGEPCRLRLVPIRRGSDRLADIRDEADADATWQTVYHLLASLKAQGHALHLCIAGGRRIMGLLTLSAAMLLCGHHDRVWHMYTPATFLERVQEGAIMHARPEDGVRLIQVPMVPWGAYFPALRDLAQPPAQVIAAQTAWLDESERAACRTVLDHLTERQREVLHLLAAGHSPQAVAERLNISLTTVNSHKTAILAECRLAWNLPEDVWLSYHFLREKFAGWLLADRSEAPLGG